jgi:osmotically-inducible protein OsmY
MGHNHRGKRDWNQGAGFGNQYSGSGNQSRYSQEAGQDYGSSYGPSQGQGGYGAGSQYQPGSESQRYGSQHDRWSRGGPHAGKGPKGYSRSDDRIREDVSEALSQHGDIDASEIEVDVQNGEVTLSGTVSSREAKRAAEETAEGGSGVKDVQNRIRVQDNAMSGSGALTSSPSRSSASGTPGSGSGGYGSSATTGAGPESGTDKSDNRNKSHAGVGRAG